MSLLTVLTPPAGLGEIPEGAVWLHSPVLCRKYRGILGLAVFSSEDLAKATFPNWQDPVVQRVFSIEEVLFEETREIAKATWDIDGNQVVAVHIHTESAEAPSHTHWVLSKQDNNRLDGTRNR